MRWASSMRSLRGVLWVACITGCTANLDLQLVNLALPQLGRAFAVNQSTLAWAVAACCTALGGRRADARRLLAGVLKRPDPLVALEPMCRQIGGGEIHGKSNTTLIGPM